MKKILFTTFLFLSIMVCFASVGWAGGLEDAKAGLAAGKRGDYDEAIRLYTKAIDSGDLSQGSLSIAYNNRGGAWSEKGEYNKAIADYTKAIEINKKNTNAYFNRGIAWKKGGEYNKAIADFNKVKEINPKHAYAYNNLAWLMATCPDGRYRNGKQAVEFAKKALELKDEPIFIDTLAAAYAEAGSFQDAIKTQEKIIAIFKEEGYTQTLSEFNKHLASYKAGKPWREK